MDPVTFKPKLEYNSETAQMSPPNDSFSEASVPFHKTKPRPNCFMAIFATRQLALKGDRELYIRYSVRELLIYVVYLITFCIMVFVNHSTLTYYYTKVMRDLFVTKSVTREVDVDADNTKTFETSTDVRDFWNYVEGPMLEGLYWENWYGSPGADKTNVKNLFVVELITDEEKKFGILYENQLMGLPRLRQLRVSTGNCAVAVNFRQLHRECFPEYTTDTEDIGNSSDEGAWKDYPSNGNSEIQNAWKYKTGSAGSWHWGHLSWYTGNGAVLNLEQSYAESKQRMKQLKQNLWITRATRAVFLDFTVYNANINLFCVVKLVWEFPATGGLITSSSIRTVKLIRYQSILELYVVFPCEILFVIFTVYYFIQEIIEMFCMGCPKYLKDLWTWLDLIILITSAVCISFSVYRYYLVKETLSNLTMDEKQFQNFEFLGYWETQFTHAVSICLFFSWVKVFKYISFNKTMTQLSSTLSRCAKDVGGFAIMFFIVFFAFAQLGYLLFGSQIEDFCTFVDSTFTLLRIILGDFNFRQIESANRALGPLFFLTYVFFVFFVLLNMFLAIINDTYSEVKAEIQAQQNEFEIADYFKLCGNKLKGKVGSRNAEVDAQAFVRLSAADGHISYGELKENLQRAKYTSIEIEMFLARFNLDQDRAFTDEETQQMLHSLEGEENAPNHVSAREARYSSVEFPSGPLEQFKRSELEFRTELTEISDRVHVVEIALSTFIDRAGEILGKVQRQARLTDRRLSTENAS